MTVVDDSVWISYLLPDDVNHAESRAWFEQLGSTEELLVPMLLRVEISAARVASSSPAEDLEGN